MFHDGQAVLPGVFDSSARPFLTVGGTAYNATVAGVVGPAFTQRLLMIDLFTVTFLQPLLPSRRVPGGPVSLGFRAGLVPFIFRIIIPCFLHV